MKIKGKEAAYVPVVGGVGLAIEGEKGYYPFSMADIPFDVSERLAKQMNTKMGIPEDVVMELHAGSMHGWHVPAAGRFQNKVVKLS